MDINKIIAGELKVKSSQVEAAVGLIDEGCTIPFIARYRKEVTEGLDDEQLRKLDERLTYLRNLEDKKKTVLNAIAGQGKLTPDLQAKIEAVMTQVELEDLYRPFKAKRRTRAMIAREKGLLPLAEAILAEELTVPAIEEAARYVTGGDGLKPILVQTVPGGEDAEGAGQAGQVGAQAEGAGQAGQTGAQADDAAALEGQMPEGAATPEEALAGAQDIIAEMIADEAVYRQHIRNLTFEMGTITSSLKSDKSAEDEKEEDAVFRMYYDFSEKVSTLPTHRILALNRGEAKKVLNVKIELPEKYPVTYLRNKLVQKDNPYTTPVLEAAAEDSYKRLIAPSIEREIRSALTEKAEDASLVVFADNLKQLLMAPPVAGQTVLGWDPGFAHGCKLAVVDPTGKVLDTAIVYVTRGKGSHDKDELMLDRMVRNNKVTLISIGNGTASRESEQYVADYLKKRHSSVKYTIVSEAGASIYSASKQAQKEFPDFTVEQRSAVSIARRIQDPLAELVKIDPKSIGVGQYQHDMNQKKLGQSLSGVVEDCVNRVGVDLNTASASLLEYVSGITPAVAANIVAYREENGRFMDRRQLMKVPKLGPKAFEQCAGFLRITGGKNPLDATAVHPESYEAVQKLAQILGIRTADLTAEGFAGISKKVKDLKATAEQVGVGTMTLTDILKELEKPARDPRQDSPAPILRSDVLAIEDLQEGMILKGTVRNVVDFGAFVDIGVHQDGLVHVSQLSNKFIKNPFDVVKVGDIVEVKVKSVDLKRHRIQLTMKGI